MEAKTYYLNEDANGFFYVSKRPMNKTFYSAIARLKCLPTKAKRITRKGVFPGAIGVSIHDEILKIKSVKMINGFERKNIKEGSL